MPATSAIGTELRCRLMSYRLPQPAPSQEHKPSDHLIRQIGLFGLPLGGERPSLLDGEQVGLRGGHQLAKRIGGKRAEVALARKLA